MDELYELSDPRHLRYVPLPNPQLGPLFTCSAPPFQIWGTPLKGTGC